MTKGDSPEGRDRIVALEKAFIVLQMFGPDAPALRIVDIAARSGMNRSSVQRLVHTLVLGGWLARDEASGLLSLTHRVCYPAHVFLKCNALIELVMPMVVSLNARTGASCDVWLRDGDSVITLARVPSAAAMLSLAPVGSRRHLFDGAPGRALLGALADEERAVHVKRSGMEGGTAARAALEQQLGSERRQGYASDSAGEVGGEQTIAAAFRDAHGRPVAVISISSAASSDNIDAAARMLLETCARLDELKLTQQARQANLEPVPRVFWPLPQDEGDPLVISSIGRAMHLLQFFHPLNPQLTLTELSRLTGLPIPTVQRITDTFIAMGYLEKDRLRRTYSLSIRWLDFLYKFQMGSTLIRSVWPRLVGLREELGLRCSFCILDRTEIVHLLLVQSRPHPAFRSAYPGYRLPAASTSGGRAMLACLPEAEMLTILAESVIGAVTAHTVTDKSEIRREIRVARDQRFALTDQQAVREEVNIAAPLLDAVGRPVGALVVSAPTADWSLERLKREVAPFLHESVAGSY